MSSQVVPPRRSNREPLLSPPVTEYLLELYAVYDEEVLLEMERLAKEQSFPIVGRLAGAFLEASARLTGAKRIFEFGSGFGFSAYWFTRGMGPKGRIICTDASEENRGLAERHLQQVNRWSQVEFLVGFAQESFQHTEGEYDIVYNDVDKGDYPQVWQLAKERIRPGGLYIADNCLWGGRVAQAEVTDDVVEGWTEAIRAHNALVASDPDFDFFVNPVRDGLIVARRKTE